MYNNYGNNGYNNYNNYNYNQDNYNGYQNVQKLPRVSKSEAFRIVSNYAYQQTGVAVSKMVKIDECPSQLRHACVNGGITFLPQYYLTIPSAQGNLVVYFYFCTLCGKLFVYDSV